MVKRAVEMEGTVTGEHGVGLVKRDYLDHELGVTTVDAMRKVSLCLLSFLPPCLPAPTCSPGVVLTSHSTDQASPRPA
jgi:hypothetical protein